MHDNATNMLQMHNVLDVTYKCNPWEHVSCATHMLQLAVRTGLKLEDSRCHELLFSCCRFVFPFRHCASASTALPKEQIAQKLHSTNFLKLQPNDVTEN
jgi:hypothetical protein